VAAIALAMLGRTLSGVGNRNDGVEMRMAVGAVTNPEAPSATSPARTTAAPQPQGCSSTTSRQGNHCLFRRAPVAGRGDPPHDHRPAEYCERFLSPGCRYARAHDQAVHAQALLPQGYHHEPQIARAGLGHGRHYNTRGGAVLFGGVLRTIVTEFPRHGGRSFCSRQQRRHRIGAERCMPRPSSRGDDAGIHVNGPRGI